jgi:hypothetical protein
MPTILPRVGTTLTPEENVELERYAAARGMRASEAVRTAILAMLREPESIAAATLPAADPASLASAAFALQRTTETLAKLLPSAEAARETQGYVREALREIAEHVGTVAGAVVPLEEDPDNFGIRAGR